MNKEKLMINKSKKHLSETKETYFQHMKIAIKISFELLLGFLMAIIHSFFPAFFRLVLVIKLRNYTILLKNEKKIFRYKLKIVFFKKDYCCLSLC